MAYTTTKRVFVTILCTTLFCLLWKPVFSANIQKNQKNVLHELQQFPGSDVRVSENASSPYNSEQIVKQIKCCCTDPDYPRNCLEIKRQGNHNSGVYTIYPIPTNPVRAFCDMETSGGGWTVFQQRGLPLEPGQMRMSFYRNWEEYDRGFGVAEKDYWLGLGNLAALCVLGDCELRVEMEDWVGIQRYVHYNVFSISGRVDSYRAHFVEFSGNANNGTTSGDSLKVHSGMQFSTYDHDRDTVAGTNCAQLYQGAWWYAGCHHSNLNGIYAPDGSGGNMDQYGIGMNWLDWHGYHYSLKFTQMKIRSRYINRCMCS